MNETAASYEAYGARLLAARRRDEAVEAFRRALALEPDSVPRRLQLADICRQNNDRASALQVLLEARHLEPRVALTHCMLGYAQQDFGEFAEARASFERSLALQPVQGDAYLGWVTCGRVTSDDRDLTSRMEDLAHSTRLEPSERAHLYAALSKAYDDLGDFEPAMAYIDRATALADPKNAAPFPRVAFAKRVDDTIRAFAEIRPHEPAGESATFIVGLPRSGTTLVEQILAEHPAVVAGGELRFWSDEEAKRSTGLNALRGDEAVQLRGAYLTKLQTLGPNAARVTDKMPVNFMYIGVLASILPNAKFVHCRRNVRDNALSLYLTPWRRRPAPCFTREDIVFYVTEYRRLMEHWRRVLAPGALIDLDYEDLVGDLDSTARTLLGHVGLDWNDRCLAPWKAQRPVGTASNWQVRQPIHQNAVEKWRKYAPWMGSLLELTEPDAVAKACKPNLTST